MIDNKKKLGELLLLAKVITPQQLNEALARKKKDPNKKIGDILIEMKAITEKQLLQTLARQYGYPVVDLNKLKPAKEVVAMVPRPICEEHNIVPLRADEKSITIAIDDPLDFFRIDQLKFILNKDVKVAMAGKDEIKESIQRFYGTKEESKIAESIEQATMTQTEIGVRGDMEAGAGSGDDAPVIKFVNLMITEALKARASDIHVEPMANRVRIRYRIDGVCQEVNAAGKQVQGSLVTRIKILADMDVAEKRRPQDGRIRIKVMGRDLDIRVSLIPTVHGESIVMRLLDKQAGLAGMEEIGFHPTDYQRFRNIIKKPNGIILITGPTGSGKTTTLYAALMELNKPNVKIITAENPVEYNIAGINQAQVRENIGLTFSRILRAMLRQAPNIILVGEIRDEETGEIAIQAALTGHLVFSTLHTNDAPSALTRLLDMGVKPFLVASSVQAIMAQRLVRMLCPKCKEVNPNPEPTMLAALNIKPEQLRGKKLFRGTGCDNCKNTGFKGRKGIFELMELDNVIREMVFKKAPLATISEHARMRGMVSLLEDGVRKVLDGLTTLEEVVSITHREDISYE